MSGNRLLGVLIYTKKQILYLYTMSDEKPQKGVSNLLHNIMKASVSPKAAGAVVPRKKEFKNRPKK